MDNSENQKNNLSGFALFKRNISIILPWFTILTVWAGSLYLWGEQQRTSVKNNLNDEIQTVKNERDKSANKADLIELQYKSELVKNEELESKNSTLFQRNRILEDSMALVQSEIRRIKSRIVEVPEYGAVELFDGQFLLLITTIIELDSTITSFEEHWRMVNFSFLYAGEKPEKLSNGERTDGGQLAIGETGHINYDNKFYVVRLLNIDTKERKATFAQFKSSVRPGSAY